MEPVWRKWIYAVSYEVIGLIMSALVLSLLFQESASLGFVVATIMAVQALIWSVVYNTLFEAWEKRQPVRGRSVRRRCVHAVLFETGLTMLTVPVIMVVLGTGFVDSLLLDLGLTACYMIYTYVFTWAYDRIFGLPRSAL